MSKSQPWVTNSCVNSVHTPVPLLCPSRAALLKCLCSSYFDAEFCIWVIFKPKYFLIFFNCQSLICVFICRLNTISPRMPLACQETHLCAQIQFFLHLFPMFVDISSICTVCRGQLSSNGHTCVMANVRSMNKWTNVVDSVVLAKEHCFTLLFFFCDYFHHCF